MKGMKESDGEEGGEFWFYEGIWVVRGFGLATDFSVAFVSQPVARFVRRLSE
jgi:hypothetical protein